MNIKIAFEIAVELFKIGRSMYAAYKRAQTEKEKKDLADAIQNHDLAKINEIITGSR